MTETNSTSGYLRAVVFLYQLRWFGAKLGLENISRLAALAGNPERKLRFIHVAGTNGKGSTCAMLASVYREAGYRVGLFTSPHLVSFRERLQVNGELISADAVVALVDSIRPLMQQFPDENHPTFFEAVTVMALNYFVQKECDLVIWETGLGGRLDATNIVTPEVSVITNVQIDHQKWLGETLMSIAREKAGIIKPGVPVVAGVRSPEPLAVIEAKAREGGSPLHRAPSFGDAIRSLGHVRLALAGEHQKRNAAVAIEVVRLMNHRWPVTDAALKDGLEKVQWPGRFQIIDRPSGQKIVLDGAHNVAGAEVLARTWRERFPGMRPTLIFGILQDKDWEGICQMLPPLARRIILTPVQNERTAAPDTLMESCRKANPEAEVLSVHSLIEAFATAETDSLVLVAGSLYLIGEALEILGEVSLPIQERGLNEWGGASTKT